MRWCWATARSYCAPCMPRRSVGGCPPLRPARPAAEDRGVQPGRHRPGRRSAGDWTGTSRADRLSARPLCACRRGRTWKPRSLPMTPPRRCWSPASATSRCPARPVSDALARLDPNAETSIVFEVSRLRCGRRALPRRLRTDPAGAGRPGRGARAGPPPCQRLWLERGRDPGPAARPAPALLRHVGGASRERPHRPHDRPGAGRGGRPRRCPSCVRSPPSTPRPTTRVWSNSAKRLMLRVPCGAIRLCRPPPSRSCWRGSTCPPPSSPLSVPSRRWLFLEPPATLQAVRPQAPFEAVQRDPVAPSPPAGGCRSHPRRPRPSAGRTRRAAGSAAFAADARRAPPMTLEEIADTILSTPPARPPVRPTSASAASAAAEARPVVTIGRIDIQVAEPVPPRAAAPARTRGFQAYARLRRGLER